MIEGPYSRSAEIEIKTQTGHVPVVFSAETTHPGVLYFRGTERQQLICWRVEMIINRVPKLNLTYSVFKCLFPLILGLMQNY